MTGHDEIQLWAEEDSHVCRVERRVKSKQNADSIYLITDYTLANPDTLTKYKTAAQISHKVLEAVTALCHVDAKIVEICQKGDQLLEEEISKVYRGKKIAKGLLLFVCLFRLHFLTSFFRYLPPNYCLSIFLRHPIHSSHL